LLVFGVPGYLNNLVLIPRLLSRHKYVAYLVSLNGLLLLTSFASFTVTQWLNNVHPELEYMGSMRYALLPYHLVPASAMMAMLAFGKYAYDAEKNERRLNEMEKQQMTSELSILRAQINPHFLFNALNTIYGLARKNDPNTPDAVIKLSDILRYGLYEVGDTESSLEHEILFLQQYVAFARLRMHRADSIQLHIDAPGAADLWVTPMLFIPFVENAIKHGSASHTIDIELTIIGKNVQFLCINDFEHQQIPQSCTPDGRSGIGIKNVKRRLELLYPDKYELNINDTNGKFLVELNLQLS
jgi:LytS/YehU family sensor histidine kinase